MAAAYWLDNQCFEVSFAQLSENFIQSPQKALILQIFTELIAQVKLLAHAQEGQEGDSLNHKAYKTVLLIQNSTML